MENKTWYLYIVECRDGTLYTGITDDISRRIERHNSGKGAKYTRSRSPVQLRYQEECGSRSDASKREYEVHHMTRQEKLELIKNA